MLLVLHMLYSILKWIAVRWELLLGCEGCKALPSVTCPLRPSLRSSSKSSDTQTEQSSSLKWVSNTGSCQLLSNLHAPYRTLLQLTDFKTKPLRNAPQSTRVLGQEDVLMDIVIRVRRIPYKRMQRYLGKFVTFGSIIACVLCSHQQQSP